MIEKLTTKSLRVRALGMVAMILLAVIAASTAAMTYGFTRVYTTALLSKSFNIGEGFRADLSKSLNLGIPLESLAGVNEKCSEITSKNGDIGYCVMTDAAGKALFASDGSLVGTTMSDRVSQAAAKSDEAQARVFTYKDKKYYDIATPLRDADGRHTGVIRLGLSYDEVSRQKNALIMRSVLLAAFFLVLAIVLFTVFMTKFIINPISELVGTATQIAQGDLSKTIKVRTEDELGELGKAINAMSANLKSMLARVKEASISVANATEKIAINAKKILEGAQAQDELTGSTSSSMEEINASVREVAESVNSLSSSAESSSSSIMEMAASIDEVADSTMELSASSESTTSSIMEMSASIRQVAENVDTLSSSAEETTASATEMGASIKEVEAASKESTALSERVTAEASELGMRSVEKTIESMENIKDTVEKAARVIEQLGERSEEIGEILNVIDEVTDQTSLLALNAAILAAQAGEHGKGFAVVATEIKDLAGRASSSTQEIAKLITAVQTEAKDAVTSIKSGKQSVEQGVRIAYEAKDALGKIVESSTRAASMSKGIEKATVEQAEGIRQVSGAMVAISDMVSQILKSIQEQSKGTEQIMKDSEKMSQIAKQVRNAMAEQAKGSKQITMAVENVSDKVQHIATATSEQKKGSQETVKALGKIRAITSQSVELAGDMDNLVVELSKQADLLRELINHFVLMSDYNLESGTIRVGFTAIDDPEVMKSRLAPFIGYLSSRLGVKVEVTASRDYSSVVNDIGLGNTDISFLGPTIYVEARHKYGVEPLVEAVGKGKTSTRAVIVTKEGSGIDSLPDISGRSFAFASEKSTTGHLMPRAMLAEAGVKLQDMRTYKYLGQHDAVAKAVISGEFDAGGMMETVARKYAIQGLKIVQRSGDIPGFNFAASKNVDRSTRDRIKAALTNLRADTPEHVSAIEAVDPYSEGFAPASDSSYDVVRKMVRQLYGIDYR